MLHKKIVETLSEAQKEQVVTLWNAEYPASFAVDGMAGYDAVMGTFPNQEHLIMEDEDGRIVGWKVIFDFQGKRWFILLVDRTHQRKGLGSQFIQWSKERNKNLLGWMVNVHDLPRTDGTLYPVPALFYQKHGFEIQDVQWEAVPFKTAMLVWDPNATA